LTNSAQRLYLIQCKRLNLTVERVFKAAAVTISDIAKASGKSYPKVSRAWNYDE
jgi:hypothetical protein